MKTAQTSHQQAMKWYQQFSGVIEYALESRIGRRADVDDLSQEVYLRLLRIVKPEFFVNGSS